MWSCFDSVVLSGRLEHNRAMSHRFSGALPRGGSLAFIRHRAAATRRPPSPSLPVLAVGQRVFVNTVGEHSGSVALGDVSGKVLSAMYLVDGTEVQVVAWRPNGRSNTRYRVQSSEGADGWLAAENL